MSQKPTKTRSELEDLLLAEIRKHPECSRVIGVAITEPPDRAWSYQLAFEGPQSANPRCYEKVSDIADKVSSEFDLSEDEATSS